MKIMSKIAAIFKPYTKPQENTTAAPIQPPKDPAPISSKWPFPLDRPVEPVQKTDTQDTYERPKKKPARPPANAKKKNWNSGQKKAPVKK